MSSVDLPDPIFIARPAALERLAAALVQEPIVAVDTESNSLHAYQEQVCLIQFSTPQKDYLVDPLALQDLSPLEPVFRSPKIEKVFHAAEYDLICLKRDFNFDLNNLFDTMLAARILGREAVGLGSLLQAEFGVHVNKRYQRANWGKRPLPADQLAYAQLDTHYLIELRNRLHRELDRQRLLPLASEDFLRACHVNGNLLENNKPDCFRINGAHDLAPKNAAVLKELCTYRDQVARRINRPLFKVIGDKTLLAIAEGCPQQPEQLKRIPGMSRRQIERHGEALLAAVRRGLQAPPLSPPQAPRPNEDFLERVDALRIWRKTTAQKMGVPSDVVLPRDLLYHIAERNPRGEDELAQLLDDVPWRLGQFGDQILFLINKPS